MRVSREWYEQWKQREANRKSSGAIVKQVVCHEPVAAKEGADSVSGVTAGVPIVSIKSFRTRLLDTDNLYGGAKYFIDGLRHALLIPDDRAIDITLKVTQEKVKKRSEERTEIEIIYGNETNDIGGA